MCCDVNVHARSSVHFSSCASLQTSFGRGVVCCHLNESNCVASNCAACRLCFHCAIAPLAHALSYSTSGTTGLNHDASPMSYAHSQRVQSCLDPWLRTKALCPLCKTPVQPPPSERFVKYCVPLLRAVG
jgi:hypothetical protein